MRRRAPALVAGLLLAAALVAPAHPSEAAPSLPPVRPTRVLVLGDSVLKGGAGVYAGGLPGREVIVDAEVNRNTGEGLAVLDRLGTDWDVVVVLLSHNDGGSPAAYQPPVRAILDRLRHVPRVSFLTLHEVRPYYPAVNQFLFSLQAEYPNLGIGDWNAVARANPGATAADGLHLNGTGASLMTDLIRGQVEIAELQWFAALARLATTTTVPPTTTTTTLPPTTTTTAPPTTTTTVTRTTAVPDLAPPAGAPAPGPAGSTAEAANNSEKPWRTAAVGLVAAAAVGGAATIRRRRRQT